MYDKTHKIQKGGVKFQVHIEEMENPGDPEFPFNVNIHGEDDGYHYPVGFFAARSPEQALSEAREGIRVPDPLHPFRESVKPKT